MAGLRIGGFPTRLPRLTLTGDLTVTKQSTTALTVARTGTTYAFQVDTNTANSATGLKVTAAAAAGGVALAAISSGADEPISLASKGAAALTLLTNSLTRVTVASTGAVTIAAPTSGTGLTVSGGGINVVGASQFGITGMRVGLGSGDAAHTSGIITIEAQSAFQSAIAIKTYAANERSTLNLWRAKGTYAIPTAITADGDDIGQIEYRVYNNSDWLTAAYLRCEVDGTPGAADAPARFVFLVSPSGSTTPAEALRIASNKLTTITGQATITGVATAGGATTLTITPGAHTAVTAESTSLSYAAQTITITGAYATQRFVSFGQPTISAASALTVTTAATVYIAGAPAVAASAVITDSFAFWVDAGTTRLDGLTWIGPTGRAVDSTFANAGMTTGITISQGTADNQVLAFKSSDVAHGVTTLTETDTFGYVLKNSGTAGGLAIVGLSETATGFNITGVAGTSDTLKTTSARGNIFLDCALKSGTTTGAHGADADLLCIANNATTRYIFDAEGTLHSVHASGTDYFGGAAGAYLAAGTVKGVGLALPHVVNKAASANVRNSHNAETSSTELAYTKVKTITITNGLLGAQRFLFDLKTAGGGATASGRIYRNGVALGTEQTDVTGGYVTKSEDLTQTWNPGDTAELYVKTSDGAQAAYVQNFRIAYDDSATIAVASANS